MKNINIIHKPVMLNEVIDNLNIIKNGIYIDGTFGCGGHSKIILEKINKYGKLIVFDKDIKSINIAKSLYNKKILYFNKSFSEIYNICKKLNILGKIDGILIDLGMSDIQLLDYNRGFSFLKNGILDMRFNINIGIPAYKLLKNISYKKINKIFNYFGDEYKYSYKISKYIYNFNKKKCILYTKQLVDIINIFHKKKSKINNATKYFQSIRMYINNDINDIKILLSNLEKILKLYGKLLVITFNSVENKLIKNFFNNINYDINYIPLKNYELFKFNNYKKYYIKKINKIKPTINEIKNNKKSRSSILTIFKKYYFNNKK